VGRRAGAQGRRARIAPADRHTARFTLAANADGDAEFTFSAGDAGIDPRLVFHYDFEAANPAADASRNERTATIAGTAAAEANVPTALARWSRKSLRLTGGDARLSRMVYPASLPFANSDWTFCAWVRRASNTNDETLLRISDTGMSAPPQAAPTKSAKDKSAPAPAPQPAIASADALSLVRTAKTNQFTVRHTSRANVADVNLSSPVAVKPNEWHHIALSFERRAHNCGDLHLSVDGARVATAKDVAWDLRQGGPVCIGAAQQSFNGWLDDVALFRGRLTPSEIARLASGSVAHLGGLTATQEVRILK
jgi:hypothetical protein